MKTSFLRILSPVLFGCLASLTLVPDTSLTVAWRSGSGQPPPQPLLPFVAELAAAWPSEPAKSERKNQVVAFLWNRLGALTIIS